MAGYIRTDVTDEISNGNNIDAIPLDTEYEAIVTAFSAVGGHTHGGAIGEGAPITVIGPSQNVVASANSLTPAITNTIDLGSVTYQYKNLWVDGVAEIDSLAADTADINAGTIDNTVIGATTPAAISATTINASGAITGALTGNVIGDITSSGSSSFASVDVNGGTIDATAIGLTTPSTAAVSNLSISGTITLTGVALTPTAAQYNFVTGATSNIQTQLNSKQATLTGAVTTITSSDLTASKALVSDGSGKVAVSGVTTTELGYVGGVTSAIQTQLNSKQATVTGGATTITSSDLTASRTLVSDGSGKVAVSAVTSVELGHLTGVTSAIQTQLDAKQSLDADLTALAAIAGVEGDIIYRNATEWTRLAKGTSGQVLRQNAGLTAPEWAAAPTSTITWATAVATTSGTAFDFAIPSTATEIYVSFAGQSLSGSDHILVQLGDAGGIENTSYVSGSSTAGGDTSSTSGFVVRMGSLSAEIYGTMSIYLIDAATFKWSQSHSGVHPGVNPVVGGGVKSLSAAVTQIRVTRAAADTFDAGSLTVGYR